MYFNIGWCLCLTWISIVGVGVSVGYAFQYLGLVLVSHAQIGLETKHVTG